MVVPGVVVGGGFVALKVFDVFDVLAIAVHLTLLFNKIAGWNI